jgi:hypothetical protein
MLILKSVESNLFDNAHFIFIRNNPTEILGVREGVLLIFININEQVSSNWSSRRPVSFCSLYYQYCQSQSYSDYLYIFLAYVSVDSLLMFCLKKTSPMLT